jgi:hypothetical protein
MANGLPDFVVLPRHRDLAGRRNEVWVRRGLLAVLVAVPVAGLFNVFGQQPTTSRAAAPGATLSVRAPTSVRGGLLYEARFEIRATRELRDARLVLAPGWLEGQQVNTIEPSPVGEASDDGSLALDLGHVPAGERHLLFLQFQVDPTNVGSHSHDVSLYDGDRRLLTIRRTATVFP